MNMECYIDWSSDCYKSLSAPSNFIFFIFIAFDLLRQMLQKKPENRISARMALRHPAFEGIISGKINNDQFEEAALKSIIRYDELLFYLLEFLQSICLARLILL